MQKIKQILTVKQYQKYVKIEKTLRPKHFGNPGENDSLKPPSNQ